MPERSPETPQDLPKARIVKRRWFNWAWLVPLFAAGFVGWLIARTYITRGPRIHIRFTQAQGLEAGKSEVKFRGAKIGMVTGIRLTKDLSGVDVKIELTKSASEIARTGSTFWIVEPEVSAAQIRGLQTIVSGDYIEAKPGPGDETNYFVGFEEPPALPQDRPGLVLVLMNPKLGSIQKGSAIYYRGLQVGQVLRYQLGGDAQAVSITAQVDEPYAALVRENTKFWNAGGLQMNLSLLGAKVRAESVKALVSGGIAFATPDQPGARVKNGAVFRLYDKVEESWEKWTPNIAITNAPPPRNTDENPRVAIPNGK